MLFIEKYKGDREAFEQKVRTLAVKLSINPDWLMATMMLESSLNPQAVNRTTNATGLIQFMPNTATALGTSVQQLYAMDGLQQLDYVYAYLKPYAGTMESLADVYFAVFFPAAIGKPDDWTLHTSKLSAGLIARQNSGYDLNRDGVLTVGEVRTAIYNRLGIKETTSGEIKKK